VNQNLILSLSWICTRIFILALCLLSIELCPAQSVSNTRSESLLPKDFPSLPFPLNDSSEIKRYRLEKDAWIQKNPEQYRILSDRPSLFNPEEERKIRSAKEKEMRVQDSLPQRIQPHR